MNALISIKLHDVMPAVAERSERGWLVILASTTPRISGNFPAVVKSLTTTGAADKSLQVAADMFTNSACALLGVINEVNIKVTWASAG